MPTDIKITTEMLYQGALAFALMDIAFVSLLVWRVREETFAGLKWSLVVAAALIWCGIWSWAIGNFWEPVYAYVRTDSTCLAPKSFAEPPDKSWQKVCENRQIWGMKVG